jgi:hypothetical protein
MISFAGLAFASHRPSGGSVSVGSLLPFSLLPQTQFRLRAERSKYRKW